MIELVMKNFQTKKTPRLDGFTNDLYRTFKKEIIPIILKLLQKKEAQRTLNSFYEISITLITKPKTQKRKLHNIPNEHRHKNPHQNTSKPNATVHQKDNT